jgi:hypothetical protein
MPPSGEFLISTAKLKIIMNVLNYFTVIWYEASAL